MTELERELAELAGRLGIVGSVLIEMAQDPARAVSVIRYATSVREARNPAAYSIVLWRSGVDPRLRLETLELAWSLEREGPREAMLGFLGAQIARAGGFRSLRR